MLISDFWKGKKVLITGHTGFKGSWLSLWLHSLGAEVTGYALDPPTEPSLFRLARGGEIVADHRGDIRDGEGLSAVMRETRPEIIFHMAAQPLVRESYKNPVETYAVNVIGTVNLLEGVRHCRSVRAVVNVTTDKCYENHEWSWGYRENDRLGGHDPYSNSKACSELVTAAYRTSFFNQADYHVHGVAIATARAGNVIGGGDWAADRLIPDCFRAILAGEPIRIRNPHAIRPWQHVLEPISGYMLLAQRLYEEKDAWATGWNFGPSDDDARPVQWLVERLCSLWGDGASWVLDGGNHPHEAHYLKLDCSKARSELGWKPRWGLPHVMESIVRWTKAYHLGKDMRALCLKQIHEYGESS
jgi:CDP-glucose 4,6-dehydratase